MNTLADKTQDRTNQAQANQVSNTHKTTARFVDHRPENLMQRKIQAFINNSSYTQQQKSLQQNIAPRVVLQLKVQIGTDKYEAYNKNGFGIQNLISLIESNKGTFDLRYDWKARIKGYVKDKAITPRIFTDLPDLLNFLTKKNSSKKTTSEKNQEQDLRIQGMNTGFGPTELNYGNILSYESRKAFGNFTGQIESKKEYMDTQMELEDIDPGERSTTSDFSKSTNPFIHLQALGSSDLSRLDFMAPNDVEINTQGYSSMGDRTVDPHTLNTSFGFGTVKIGPNISSYIKEMDSTSTPDPDQLGYLNSLEMLRFPHLSPQTGMKRELYNQGKFSKDQGMGYNHDHSSGEFVGAISGSTMTNLQRDNLRKQQTYSNYAILQTAYQICPDDKLGQALSNGKHVPTSREEMEALKHFIAVAEDPHSTHIDKNKAKQALRKVLVQVLRSVTQIEDIESDDETHYPTSPYNPNDY